MYLSTGRQIVTLDGLFHAGCVDHMDDDKYDCWGLELTYENEKKAELYFVSKDDRDEVFRKIEDALGIHHGGG